jgi:hypothetical protein
LIHFSFGAIHRCDGLFGAGYTIFAAKVDVTDFRVGFGSRRQGEKRSGGKEGYD